MSRARPYERGGLSLSSRQTAVEFAGDHGFERSERGPKGFTFFLFTFYIRPGRFIRSQPHQRDQMTGAFKLPVPTRVELPALLSAAGTLDRSAAHIAREGVLVVEPLSVARFCQDDSRVHGGNASQS